MTISADWVAQRAVELCQQHPDKPIRLCCEMAAAEYDLGFAPETVYRHEIREIGGDVFRRLGRWDTR